MEMLLNWIMFLSYMTFLVWLGSEVWLLLVLGVWYLAANFNGYRNGIMIETKRQRYIKEREVAEAELKKQLEKLKKRVK